VINKADRPGAAEARRDLDRVLDLGVRGAWRPPILSTCATAGEGVEELWSAIVAHRDHLNDTGELQARRRARVADELTEIVAALLRERARTAAGEHLDRLAARVAAREIDPWTAAEELLPD
jgi:LAO/AO transport system kinase